MVKGRYRHSIFWLWCVRVTGTQAHLENPQFCSERIQFSRKLGINDENLRQTCRKIQQDQFDRFIRHLWFFRKVFPLWRDLVASLLWWSLTCFSRRCVWRRPYLTIEVHKLCWHWLARIWFHKQRSPFTWSGQSIPYGRWFLTGTVKLSWILRCSWHVRSIFTSILGPTDFLVMETDWTQTQPWFSTSVFLYMHGGDVGMIRSVSEKTRRVIISVFPVDISVNTIITSCF